MKRVAQIDLTHSDGSVTQATDPNGKAPFPNSPQPPLTIIQDDVALNSSNVFLSPGQL